jgi:hypothetical protein
VSPLLPAAYGTENEEERRIRVTRELVMKSYQTSRGTSILDLSEWRVGGGVNNSNE